VGPLTETIAGGSFKVIGNTCTYANPASAGFAKLLT
jgi:hypothetical protein